MTSGVPEAFGFAPAHVVADLQDIGNWKSRATAIDVLHKCLTSVVSPATLVPALADFVTFLVGLIADPNIKIAISAMSILGDLAAKVGSELAPHLRVMMPAVVEKFMDSKILVRSAAMKLVRRLMTACSPKAVLSLLAYGSSHSNWRVREEVLNAFIMALLSFAPGSCEPVAAYMLLSSCLSDSKDKVRLVALEGMAVLHSRLGSGDLSALMAGQGAGGGPALPDVLRSQVATRLANPALPGINEDGMVEHVMELPPGDNPDMRLVDATYSAAGGGVGTTAAGSNAPWAEASTPARPRLRPSASSEGPITLSGPGAGPGHGRPAPSLEQVGRMGSDPLPGCRRGPVALVVDGTGSGCHYRPDDPAALSPACRVDRIQPFAPTPSRFCSHEPLAGAAPITSAPALSTNGWGHPQHSQGHSGRSNLGERRTSPARESSASTLASVGTPATAASPSFDSIQDRGVGSVPPGHSSALQPLKHHWGASRSMESHVPAALAGRSPGDSSENSPLSPTRGYTVLVHGRHSGPAGISDAPQRDSLDFLVRPTSVRTQAAAELREARGANLHAHTQVPGQPQQPPLTTTHPSMGWLQSSFEHEPAGNRQETFSPSKAEMLARLKTRQIEKRAATAQQVDASLTSVVSDASAAHHNNSAHQHQQNPRRYLFTQLSDQQRDRDRGASERPDAARGYDSAASTPTRAMGQSGSPFDEAPASAQSHRPPRGGLAARLGRGPVTAADGATGAGGGMQLQPGVQSPILPGSQACPPAGDEAPLRIPSPSPALNRLRVRSADPNSATLGAGTSSGSVAVIPATPIDNGGGPTCGPNWEKARSGDLATEELMPVPDPEKHIRVVISRLVEANHADRKELDWQGQYEALIDARRLLKHHPEVVRGCLHEFVRAATPAIDQLRSQTAKCALTLFQECFSLLGRAMDRELDEMVPVLLKKAGEVSNAGRDTFLAAEADRALGEMYRCCGESRSVTALLGCAGHKSPYVRVKVAFHLDNHLEACAGAGGGRQALANNSACIERLFRVAASFLDEGLLDTRTHGKRIIWHVKAMLASRTEFDRLVADVAPESLRRKVVDVVEGLNGPPPPPSRGVVGGAAAATGGGIGGRLASRQLGGPSTGGGACVPGSLASPARPLLDQAAGSLTQPPPPVRQGSYSAPSPLHSGAATPERRRLPRQRTTDLDGIPEGNGAGRNTSSKGRQGRMSAGTGPTGAGSSTGSAAFAGGSTGGAGGRTRHAASADGSGSGFGPGVVEVVVKALQLLSAKDFRERMDALHSLEGVTGALPGAPDSLLMQVLDALVARLGDANAKVSMLALELVGSLAGALRQRMALGLNTLVPALAGQLGSTNDKVRAAAVAATDKLLNALDPGMLVQHFSHSLANGTIQRGKPVLAEKLVQIVSALHGAKPQLVARYAVPAAFALLNDGRGGVEVKAAAGVLLTGLARLMGVALLDQAVSLNAVAQQRVADAVVAATGQPVNAGGARGGERDRDRTPRGG